MSGTIDITQEGHVFILSFAHGNHNHVSLELMSRIADSLESLDTNDDCRCIIIRSEGRVFCAGADIATDGQSDLLPDGTANPLYEHAVRMFAIKKPIIAAVQGAAVGAGSGIALACDFRVAGPKARFAANFVSLGFHAGFGISYSLPYVIGQQNAGLMLMTGRRVKPQAAQEMGLVDILSSEGTLMSDTMNLAQEIAQQAPLAVEATKKTLRGELAQRIKDQTDLEWSIQHRLTKTEDFKEGVLAVKERRPGKFVKG